MDKALRSFEYTNEWADLISALAKINKVKHDYGHQIGYITCYFELVNYIYFIHYCISL